MKILIGYYQRSGSTLLQHLLSEHSRIRSYSDLSSLGILPLLLMGYTPDEPICVKPIDVFFTIPFPHLYRVFDKFIWLARDPRDSYLSALEVNYAYNFWLPGKKIRGIDVGLLQRWKIVYKSYFQHQNRWHLVRYEDLVEDQENTLRGIYTYLKLPYEAVEEFRKFHWLKQGGDPKLRKTSRVHRKSARRFKEEMSTQKQRVFTRFLGEEMRSLGYI
jgi:hypothetical protein